jgi:hypothetical protein
MLKSLPDQYPAPDEIELGANIVSLFEIIKKFFNKKMNNDIQINESKIVCRFGLVLPCFARQDLLI